MHDAITLIRWFVRGVCDVHGVGSPGCTAAEDVGTLATTTLVGAALGTVIGGEEGAVPGGLFGFVAGLVLNDRPQPT